MFDKEKIDSYFKDSPKTKNSTLLNSEAKHSRLVRNAKLILPSFAAVLLGILLIYPYLVPQVYDIKLEITYGAEAILPGRDNIVLTVAEIAFCIAKDTLAKLNLFILLNISLLNTPAIPDIFIF